MFSLPSLSIAATPIDGLYVSGYGGGAYLPGNIDRTNANNYVHQSQYDSGFDAGAALGYKSDAWRIEAEVNVIKANLKQLNLNATTVDDLSGYSDAALGLLNGNYDLPLQLKSIQAYIGGGLGYGWLQNNYSLPMNIQENIRNMAFAYQGVAGLFLHITERFTLGVNYRYLSTTHVNTLGSRFQANLLNGSLTYRFDRNQS